jgi:hypothetical protein
MWVHDEAAWFAFKDRLVAGKAKLTSEITVMMNGIPTKLTTILYNDENYVRLRDRPMRRQTIN